jgi:hypothetical protein
VEIDDGFTREVVHQHRVVDVNRAFRHPVRW